MCELDLFYAENEDYAERLAAANVSCEVHRVSGSPHAFEVFEPDANIANSFQRSAIEFLRRALSSNEM